MWKQGYNLKFVLLLVILFPLIHLFFIQEAKSQPKVSMNQMEEYKAKSIFIFSVCKFTTWPEDSNREASDPFIISVLGKLPHGSQIFIPKGKTIANRTIVLKSIKKLEQINGSNVLFITSSENHRIQTILDYVGNKSILTVGDTEGYAQKGVIINFFIDNKQLRFEINPDSIKKAKLAIHSQLYTMGKVVKTKSISRVDNGIQEHLQ